MKETAEKGEGGGQNQTSANLVVIVSVLLVFIVIIVNADGADDVLLLLLQKGDVDGSRPILPYTVPNASNNSNGGEK